MQYADLPNLREVLPGILSRADRLDETGNWPEEDLHVLSTLGAMRWAVPLRQGGEELSPIELHFRYEAIASASLTTALILSQRDSAVSIIASAEDSPLRDELLVRLGNNEMFSTVGVAQLTTSRQRGAPALRATPQSGGRFTLDGEIPWATGAARAAMLITGGTLPDGRQILAALPTDSAGLTILPPMPLVALRSSHTTSVACESVSLDARHILIGPIENALSIRRNTLPIGQSFLAMGLTSGAIELIREIDSPIAREAALRLSDQLSKLRSAILDYCNPVAATDPQLGTQLRGQAIDLAIRSTHAAVSLHKGAALLRGHPAQRLARESLFLLVWSCPSPVVECAVDLLTSAPPDTPRNRASPNE